MFGIDRDDCRRDAGQHRLDEAAARFELLVDADKRARIIDRWQELEGREQSPQYSIPQTRAEALRLAADLEEQTDKVPRLSGQFI